MPEETMYVVRNAYGWYVTGEELRTRDEWKARRFPTVATAELWCSHLTDQVHAATLRIDDR